MAVILSLLGIVLAAAGVAAVGFGIPINEFTLGTTLVLAGTTALAGGLILIGLAAVVAELGRVTAALQTRVVARPTSRPAEAAERVAPPAPSIVAGSSAIDRCWSGARDRRQCAACRGRCSAAPPARSAVARRASELRRPPRCPHRRQSMSHRPRSNGCAPVFREPSDQRPSPRSSPSTKTSPCLPTGQGTITRNHPSLRLLRTYRQSRRLPRKIARVARLSMS